MKKFKLFITLSFMIVSFIGFAQNAISGVVSDSEGIPLPGATVVVEGTSNGVTSDFDGKYTIMANAGDTLVFSYVGYNNQSVVVGTSATVNVLLASANTLNEVVVTGITTQERQRLASNIVTIGGDKIEGVALSSPDQALQGRVAGLRVNTVSGSPGTPVQIRIRGEGSIAGSNAPLFVIDGVPMINSNQGQMLMGLGPLSMINSADIESMTVLKDGSATAPYGARGSNGVIVITTKRGQAGDVKFNFSSQYGFQNYARGVRKNITGVQRLELGAETLMNTYGYTKTQATDYVLANFFNYSEWDRRGRVDSDWDALTRVEDAPYQNYDISASGGNATENFRISLGYKQQQGTTIGVNFESLNASLNFRKNVGKLEIITNNRFTDVNQQGRYEGAAYYGAPQMARIFNSPVNLAYNEDGTYNTNLVAAHNSLFIAEFNLEDTQTNRWISNNSLNYRLNDEFKLSTRYAVDYISANGHRFWDKREGDGEGYNGYAYQSSERSFQWSTQTSLTYNKEINNTHFIQAVGRFAYNKTKNNFINAKGEDVAALGLKFVNSFGSSQTASGSFSDAKSMSYLALLNYSFKDKYILDLSFTKEGSSLFATDFRWGDFFSVASAWNIAKENFLADSEIISNLKLRVSYGETGSNGVGRNQFQSLFGYSGSYNDGGTVYPTAFGNAIISWEKQVIKDVGIDFGFLNERISGAIGYFERNTNDLLQGVPLSGTTGHGSQTRNIGAVMNKGVEIELDADVLKLGDFTWNLYGNYATLDNEVTRLATDAAGNDINLDGGIQRTRVGESIGNWYMRHYYPTVNPDNGKARYYTSAEDPTLTESYAAASQQLAGERIPTYSGGLGTRVTFRGFYADANFYFAGGNKVYEYYANYTQASGLYSTLYYNANEILMDRWQKPGDITRVPKMEYSYSSTVVGASTSTRFLYDADFVRLRDVAIGYNVPSKWTEKAGLDGVNIALRGVNLWTWVKDDNLKMDPEMRNSGTWTIYAPPLKSISLGINLKF